MPSRQDVADSELVKRQFALFDDDGNGSIERSELCKVLKALDASMWTDVACNELLDGMDANKDGKVSFKEFVDFVFQSAGDGEEAMMLTAEEEEALVAKKKEEGKEPARQVSQEEEKAPEARQEKEQEVAPPASADAAVAGEGEASAGQEAEAPAAVAADADGTGEPAEAVIFATLEAGVWLCKRGLSASAEGTQLGDKKWPQQSWIKTRHGAEEGVYCFESVTHRGLYVSAKQAVGKSDPNEQMVTLEKPDGYSELFRQIAPLAATYDTGRGALKGDVNKLNSWESIAVPGHVLAFGHPGVWCHHPDNQPQEPEDKFKVNASWNFEAGELSVSQSEGPSMEDLMRYG